MPPQLKGTPATSATSGAWPGKPKTSQHLKHPMQVFIFYHKHIDKNSN